MASILLVRRLREVVADAHRTIDVAQARVDAIESMGTLLDRQDLERGEPWFCGDCNQTTSKCTCEPHGWEE